MTTSKDNLAIQDPPLRSFTVLGSAAFNHESVTVEGQQPIVSATGALEILRYSGGMIWTVAIFAAGSWSHMKASLPTPAEVEIVRERNAAVLHHENSQNFLSGDIGNTILN